MPDINSFLNSFNSWVQGQNHILAVALVGSHARGEAKSGSDMDLVIITENPELYLDNNEWVKIFGKVKEIKKEDYKIVQAVRVLYKDGLEAEFGITIPKWAETNPVDTGTRNVVTGGLKILYDKDGILLQLQKAVA